MKISEHSIKHLAKAICGDYDYMPYLKGYQLVELFNQYGFNDVYEAGFPSRWLYTENKIRELNETNRLSTLIEKSVDPRRFLDTELDLNKAVNEINKFLKFDSYQLTKFGEFFKIADTKGIVVQPETANKIDHKFIKEQIAKCQTKILQEDYNGAITNSRSLIEAIFIEIIEQNEGKEIKNDGKIENLWGKVKKIMKLTIDKETMPDFVIQTLSGIDTALKGLAGLSNNAGDRHANKFKTKKHHAKLAVNLSMTISDFLLDSQNYQNGSR